VSRVLSDLANDVKEQHDLAKEQPEVLARLTRLAEQARTAAGIVDPLQGFFSKQVVRQRRI